jgi:hypothetical protein
VRKRERDRLVKGIGGNEEREKGVVRQRVKEEMRKKVKGEEMKGKRERERWGKGKREARKRKRGRWGKGKGEGEEKEKEKGEVRKWEKGRWGKGKGEVRKRKRKRGRWGKGKGEGEERMISLVLSDPLACWGGELRWPAGQLSSQKFCTKILHWIIHPARWTACVEQLRNVKIALKIQNVWLFRFYRRLPALKVKWKKY